MYAGSSRWSDNFPWTGATGVLSCTQSQLIASTVSSHDNHMLFTCYCAIYFHIQIGVRQYVRCLEQSIISTLAHFDRHGYTTDDTGVWVTNCDGNPNKICAIGRSRKYPFV